MVKRSLFFPAALAAVLAGGCRSRSTPAPTTGPASATPAASVAPASASTSVAAGRRPSPRRTGSVLARTVTSDALLVADEDHGVLRRVALPLEAHDLVEVTLPGPPGQVLVRDGEAWVTVRDPGLLLGFAIEGRELREVARIALPADAWGMALSPDETTLAVTSAWTHTVSLVDLPTRSVTASLDVAREPRAAVFAPDGRRLYVTHLVGTALTRIDLGDGAPRVAPVDLPAGSLRAPWGSTPGASLAYSATLSPDGRLLFVPRHALGTLVPLDFDQRLQHHEMWTSRSWFGSSTVDTLVLERDEPLAPRRTHPGAVGEFGHVQGLPAEAPRRSNPPSSEPVVFPQPRDVVYRPSTRTLLVVSEGASRVSELDALSVDPSLGEVDAYDLHQQDGPEHSLPTAPQGLVLSADERTAWTFGRGTYALSEITLRDPFPAFAPSRRPGGEVRHVTLASDPLGPQVASGRRDFYDATDRLMSQRLACAGCHPEGRDDGFVWREIEDTGFHGLHEGETRVFVGHPSAVFQPTSEGVARQTPMLAGRVSAAGPYGWHGQARGLTERLVEGFHRHRWSRDFSYKDDTERAKRASYLVTFLSKGGLRPPPRPARALTVEEERGKAIFLSEKARCASCHPPGSEYTTRATTPLRLPLPTRPGFAPDDEPFKVPSLLFVGGTAPYYHDGSAPTLEALIEKNGDRMGQTGHLDASEKKALVAFLRTL